MFDDILEDETEVDYNLCGYCESFNGSINRQHRLPNEGWCNQMSYMVNFFQRACQYMKEIE